MKAFISAPFNVVSSVSSQTNLSQISSRQLSTLGSASSSFTRSKHVHPLLHILSNTTIPPTLTPLAVSASEDIQTFQVEKTDLPKSRVQLNIKVPGKDTKQVFEKVVDGYVSQANIPGFRKGKVPRQVVVQTIGAKNVKGATCEQIVNDFTKKALNQLGIQPVGEFEFVGDGSKASEEFIPGKVWEYSVEADVYPEVTIKGDYKSLTVEAVDEGFDEALVDKYLEELRVKESTLMIAPQDAKTEMGSVCVVTMEGYFRDDSKPYKKGDLLPQIASGDKIELKMEQGLYMPGLVEQCLGMKVDEKRDIEINFPEQAGNPALRGVKAIFEITMEAIQSRVLPELNDDFAKNCSDAQSLAELREKVKDRISQEQQDNTQQNINKALEDALVDLVEVDIPQTLIDEQTKRKFANMMADFRQQQNMTDEMIQSMINKENYEKYAKRALPNVLKLLQTSFAIAHIVKQENITVSKEELDQQVQMTMKDLDGKDKEGIDENELRASLEGEIERKKVFDLLKKTTKIKMIPKAEMEPTSD